MIAATNREAEGRDARRAVPGGSLLPPERHPPRRPAAARAPGGHPLLIDHVLKSLRKRGLDRVRAVSPEAMRRLMEYPWPGNVRELENVLERGAVCSRGAVLGMEDIADEVREHGRARPKETTAVPAADLLAAREDAPHRSTDDAPTGERDLCFGRSRSTGGTRERPQQKLGIDRSTLWRKMKRLGIA